MSDNTTIILMLLLGALLIFTLIAFALGNKEDTLKKCAKEHNVYACDVPKEATE